MTRVLDRARAMPYRVGTNPRRGAIGALWTLALPSLDISVALQVGEARAHDADAVGAVAQRLIGHEGGRLREDGLQEWGGGRPVDLLWIAGGSALLRHDRALAAKAARLLPPGGLLYFEQRGSLHRQVMGTIASHLRLQARFLLAPLLGPVRALVPAGDEASIRAHAARGQLSSRSRLPGRSWLERRIFTRQQLRDRAARFGYLFGHSHRPVAGPPAYVTAVARTAGVDLRGRRWSLLAPGDYATQKLLMPIHADGSASAMIAKITPDPSGASRLANEADALRLLAGLALPPGVVVPRLTFAGIHAGRAVVGESWIDGVEFRLRAAAAATCPLLRVTSEWLTALGGASVERRPAGEVADALRQLFDTFVSVYRPPEGETRFLAERIETIARHEGFLPVVLQHGDPGSWNMLLDGEGRVAILDWESAEPAGIPLWDLLYFLRSYGSLVSRRAGIRGRLPAAAHHFITATPMHSFITQTIHDSARDLALPAHMIEPLFYLCWMHRALKESTRRPLHALERAHYRRLLHLLIERRGDPALDQLLLPGYTG